MRVVIVITIIAVVVTVSVVIAASEASVVARAPGHLSACASIRIGFARRPRRIQVAMVAVGHERAAARAAQSARARVAFETLGTVL